MDDAGDSARVVASLAAWVDRLTIVDQEADQVTALLVNSIVAWGRDQGWRVYRRAPSVMMLPAPFEHRHSCLDVACARSGAAPIAIEVDRSDRRRTVEKLLAEAGAGRIAIWVRWGTGRFEPPPAPVAMVTCPVTVRRGLDRGRRYSRLPPSARPAPQHTPVPRLLPEQAELFREPPEKPSGS